MPRSLRITGPYSPVTAVDTPPPGGASMNGMNLSGKPGIVQPMQMPPTFGQPPIPAIQPRLGTLQLTTGPQQPIVERDDGREPGGLVEQPGQRLHEVLRLHGTARHVDDREPRRRAEVPAE